MDIDAIVERDRARDVDANNVDVPDRTLLERIEAVEAMEWWRDGSDYLLGDGDMMSWLWVLATLKTAIKARIDGTDSQINAANSVLADTLIAQLEVGLPE